MQTRTPSLPRQRQPELEHEYARPSSLGYEQPADTGLVRCLSHGFPTPLARAVRRRDAAPTLLDPRLGLSVGLAAFALMLGLNDPETRNTLLGVALLTGTGLAFAMFARRALASLPPELLGIGTAGVAGMAFMIPDLLIGTPFPQVRTTQMLEPSCRRV